MRTYSTKETAEILGVATATVRAMVDRGDLGCCGHLKQKRPDKHRKIRIGHNHIAEYVSAHTERFDEATLKRFNADKKAEETIIVQSPAYSESDLDDEHQEERTQSETPYILSVNDRIAIGNVTRGTAVQMFLTLLNDPICCIESIKIEVMKR